MAHDFTLHDFRRQLDQIHQLGFQHMLKRLPGELFSEDEDADLALHRIRRIIDAMTYDERSEPDIIDGDRLLRIAADSGTQPRDVDTLLGKFRQVRMMMREMAQMSRWQRIKLVLGLGKLGEGFGPLPP